MSGSAKRDIIRSNTLKELRGRSPTFPAEDDRGVFQPQSQRTRRGQSSSGANRRIHTLIPPSSKHGVAGETLASILEGFDIPVLGIEDLILGLAVHGSKHGWRRLNWIADIAGLISAHPEIDWGGMLLRAGEWRCRRQLLTAVTLASSLYSVELPPLVRKAAQEQAVRSAVAHICSRLFRRECRTIASVTSDFLYRFRCYDSASSRLRFVRNWLGCLVQADENRILLPMSKNLSRVHRAAAALRSCWAQAKAGERPSPRPSQGETKDEAAQ